jgi:hypothetical protein
MSTGPDDLYLIAQAYLDDCAEALDTIPDFIPELEGAPERQFLSPGMPVADFVGRDCCTQLVVRVDPIGELDTTPGGLDAGRRAVREAWKNSVTMVAHIFRCIPTGTSSATAVFVPPSADALTTSARQHYADAWALWNHLHNLVRAEHLVSLCDEVFFDGLIPMIPAGGCAGWTAVIRVGLEGYEELLIGS